MRVIPYIVSNMKNSLLKTWSVKTGRMLSKPYQVSIQPNERCNARCLMCDCWKEKKDYLTKDDVIGVIRELEAWMGSHFFVQIAGGEPLIFKGIYDIFRYCTDHDILCKISTNGLLLNEKTCDRIIASGLRYLTVSIDSHVSEVHDRYRGVPGALNKALKGLAYLKKNSDMVLGISSIIMKENVGDLRAFTDFLLSLNVDRIVFQPVRAYGIPLSDWKQYLYWVDDLEALETGIAYIKAKNREDKRLINTSSHLDIMVDYFRDPKSILNRRDCHVGFEQLNIDYKGEVFLCDAYPAVGNILESGVRELWQSARAMDVRRKMVTCGLPCTSNCKKELTFREKVDKFLLFFKAGLFKK